MFVMQDYAGGEGGGGGGRINESSVCSLRICYNY